MKRVPRSSWALHHDERGPSGSSVEDDLAVPFGLNGTDQSPGRVGRRSHKRHHSPPGQATPTAGGSIRNVTGSDATAARVSAPVRSIVNGSKAVVANARCQGLVAMSRSAAQIPPRLMLESLLLSDRDRRPAGSGLAERLHPGRLLSAWSAVRRGESHTYRRRSPGRRDGATTP